MDLLLYFMLYKYLMLSLIIFCMGVMGIFMTRSNIMIMMMSMELMLLSVNLLFMFMSMYMDDMIGQMFSLYMLTMAAAESAMGLALMVMYYSLSGTMSVDYMSSIKG